MSDSDNEAADRFARTDQEEEIDRQTENHTDPIDQPEAPLGRTPEPEAPLGRTPEPPVPVFEPRVKTEGHREICAILLPTLLHVVRDELFIHRGPREQVREACSRSLA